MINVGLIDEHGVSNKECMIGFSVCGVFKEDLLSERSLALKGTMRRYCLSA